MSDKGNIFQKIPKIMGEVGPIGKNGKNTFDNYKFRSIDDVYNKLQPVLSKHEVFFVPCVLDSKEELYESQKGNRQVRVKLKVKYTFYSSDGSSFESDVEGEAIDRGDKATNKAMQAALKYMLLQVFCIAIESSGDPDADSPSLSKRPSQTTHPKGQHRQTTKVTPKKDKAPDVLAPETSLSADLNEIGAFEITWGKQYKGYTIAEMDPDQLQRFRSQVESGVRSRDKSNSSVAEEVRTFLAYSKVWLEYNTQEAS